MTNKLRRVIKALLYLFALSLTLQTKYIISPSEQNYSEMAIYFNYILLLFLSSLFFVDFYRQHKNAKTRSIPKQYLLIVGLDFFIFLSLLASSYFYLSLFRYVLFLLALALFFVLLNFKINLKKIILFFVIGVFLQAIIGVWQFFGQNYFSNKYLGASWHDASAAGTAVIELPTGRFIRSYGLLDHPNIFGGVVFFALIFTIFLLLQPRLKFWKKIFLYFVYFVLLLALLVSFSRSAYLAFVFSGAIIFIATLLRAREGYFEKNIPFFAYSFLFLLVFLLILKPFIFSRFNFDSRLEKISVDERVQQAASSREIIRDNLWLGVGPGAYSYNLLNINPELESYQAQPVHNTFLLILSEIGLAGVLLFVCLMIYLLKSSLEGEDWFINLSIYSGLFIFMTLDHWLWSLPFGLLILFFILGLTSLLAKDRKFKELP